MQTDIPADGAAVAPAGPAGAARPRGSAPAPHGRAPPRGGGRAPTIDPARRRAAYDEVDALSEQKTLEISTLRR